MQRPPLQILDKGEQLNNIWEDYGTQLRVKIKIYYACPADCRGKVACSQNAKKLLKKRAFLCLPVDVCLQDLRPTIC